MLVHELYGNLLKKIQISKNGRFICEIALHFSESLSTIDALTLSAICPSSMFARIPILLLLLVSTPYCIANC